MSLATDAPAGCLLEVSNVSKAVPGVVALDDVSLRVKRGTVHALIGENGAGKSTLMKIIAGIYTPDAGELRLHGSAVHLGYPRQALQNGIAMIHQELNLMPFMSVAENIWIRREPLNAPGLISHRELRRKTHALLELLRIDVVPQAEVLIMDEPTSALTERDAEHLFAIIRELQAQGKSILYITHKMEELFEIADELSVLRDGRYIGSASPGALTRDEIIRMMVGRELSQIFPCEPARPGAVVLSARDLTLEPQFYNVSFDLHAGEILGIAGLVGSGRSQLAAALFGLTAASSGQLWLEGCEVKLNSPQAAMSRGMAF